MGGQTRILVVGGCGFVGSHVASSLAAHGDAPLIYDNLSSGYRKFAGGLPLIEGERGIIRVSASGTA
jgi:UDP-glucose 4-epimerase